MNQLSEKVFCAFCKLPRRFYNKKHINWTNVLLSALCAFLIMYIMWQGFDAKVSVVFVFCLIFAEAFVKLRWRLSIVCPHCGFDPVIYTKNPDVACQKVKKRLADRRESGDYLLSSNDPFRNLPKLKSPPAADPPRLSKHI